MKLSLPEKLYSASQLRELDRFAIESMEISSYTLMSRAAEFSYTCLKNKWPKVDNIIIICGGGNNAGDGYLLSVLAKLDAKKVSVFYLVDPKNINDDVVKAYQAALSNNIKISPFSVENFMQLRTDVVVDAIFGTGLNRNIENFFYDAIEAINIINTNVMSIDIASGLNADTGSIMNIAVKANLTATFIGLKKGMLTGDGKQYSGLIKFSDLGVDENVYVKVGKPAGSILDFNELQKQNLVRRSSNSHKGDFGHTLIIGGDHGYIGAARMAAEAAARVGSGLVSIATRSSHAELLSLVRPEIMSHGIESKAELEALLTKVDVVAIGPGLGSSAWARELFMAVVQTELPLIIDADALGFLEKCGLNSKKWIITPHPGEAALLLNIKSKEIQLDRYKSLVELNRHFKCPVILKGSGTLFADTKNNIFVCNEGNPGMSSGGMGDVLTGVIAGLVAQKIDIETAGKLGICLHALAADKAANTGERGLLALDLMPHIYSLVNP